MAEVTICSDLGAPQNQVSHCFLCFPIFAKVMGPDAMILVFWMLSFKSFLHSPLSCLSGGSLSLSSIKVVSSAYLRLLIFLPAILIPACASSSLAFHIMYTSYKLNKQGDNIHPWYTPFPIWNQSVVPCSVLSSVQFSLSVVSDSMRPHELQHARPPCPSPAPRVYPNSCPSSQWCHPAISSSIIPFSSCPQSLPASGLFRWVKSLYEVAKILELQLQHQSFQGTPRTDLL